MSQLTLNYFNTGVLHGINIISGNLKVTNTWCFYNNYYYICSKEVIYYTYFFFILRILAQMMRVKFSYWVFLHFELNRKSFI